MEISALFGISVEELLADEESVAIKREVLYESKTEYDMFTAKRIDLHLGGARQVLLTGSDDEKIFVRLLSHSIKTLRQDLKVRIGNSVSYGIGDTATEDFFKSRCRILH